MTYNYNNISTEPTLKQIHIDVAASSMTDKTIEYCVWDEDSASLKVTFTNTLSTSDKNELDTIVANNS